METTATSDWSPFHVVGGLRPNTAGGLSPVQGKFTAAAEECAEFVRTDVNDPERADLFTQTDPESRSQAAWLLIDELNRADIDKSIGSLFTVLSSCDPDHLSKTPIDLWFEPEPTRQRLWVPARFRIIGAMNDFDTSFVNTISQGLSRRFQFVTVPAPTIQATTENPVTTELENAFLGAFAWLDRTYGGTFSLPSSDEIRESLQDCLSLLQKVLDGLRQPSNVGGWPVGTAQAVDMLRVIILQTTSRGHYRNTYELLDLAIADRLIPQMAGINDDQIDEFTTLWSELGLKEATRAMQHVVDPHGMDLS